MNFIEFIGFLALLLYLAHSARNTKKGKLNPDEIDTEELEQAERLKEFLQGVKSDMKQVAAARAPLPKPQKETARWDHSPAKPHKAYKEKHPKGHGDAAHILREPASFSHDQSKDPYAIRRDAYVIKEKKKSRAYFLKQRLKNPQDMVLWHEIIGQAKALKDERSKNFFIS